MEKTLLITRGIAEGIFPMKKSTFCNLYICKGVFLTFLGPALVQKKSEFLYFDPNWLFRTFFIDLNCVIYVGYT